MEEFQQISVEEWLKEFDEKLTLPKRIKRFFTSNLYWFRQWFVPRHKLTKEHIAAGFTWRDAPQFYSDGWNAYSCIAWEVYPILVRFRKAEKMACPPFDLSEEEWDEIIDKMIGAFYLLIKDDIYTDEEASFVEEGRALFHTYYKHLWD